MSTYSKITSVVKDTGKAFLFLGLGVVALVFAYRTLIDKVPTIYADIAIDSSFLVDPSEDLCFVDMEISSDMSFGDYTTSEATEFIKNHIDLGRDGKGFTLTNEMLKLLTIEHNSLVSSGRGVNGFHIYYADKESTGGRPALVFMPFEGESVELALDYVKVLVVDPIESAPCPMMCGGFELLPYL